MSALHCSDQTRSCVGVAGDDALHGRALCFEIQKGLAVPLSDASKEECDNRQLNNDNKCVQHDLAAEYQQPHCSNARFAVWLRGAGSDDAGNFIIDDGTMMQIFTQAANRALNALRNGVNSRLGTS